MNNDFLGMDDSEFMNAAPLNEDLPVETTEDEVSVEQGDNDEIHEQDSDTETGYEESDDADTSEEEEYVPDVEEFQRILQPFKANGTEVKVRNIDEAIQLMQMGANYTKKMQALQPNMKILKTLEKQGLLEEDKLNYLIDLSKGDPKAIAKLVKDADPDWAHVDEDEEYTPNDHQVPEATLQLEQVLDDLESTPTGVRCIDVVGNQWDDSSRAMLTKEPELLRQLNEQMQLGIFDKIMAEVERTKVFGGLVGQSDFEAYRAVGARLYQEGKLGNHTQQQPVARTGGTYQDTARNTQRKAAATPNAKKRTSAKSEYSPLAMSDEEFLKINNIHI